MANPNKKIIISIEANEFGGKSTVAKALVEKLNSLGFPNVNAKYDSSTIFPGRVKTYGIFGTTEKSPIK